ncbi:MAG: FdhF/YdeP family oxidoreductase [Anaerolineae bacterium]
MAPFGIGQQRPNNYLEVWRAIGENSDQLPFAWRILTQGVCDGCALGSSGLRDWTQKGVHLCNIRLRLLRLNTMAALDPAVLADVAPLAQLTGSQLRGLGRLPYPMVRRRGEAGFSRVSWGEAMDLVAEAIRRAPDRAAFYLTSRGIANEVYYTAQKAVRAMGSNAIDSAARVCHSPSTGGLKAALGVAATTCSYTDWIGTDLLVFLGCNPANNQPVTTKYMHAARKAGTRIVLVNAYREPGMERYWIPSIAESAVFGTRLAEDTFLVNIGGDIAFLNGAMKHMAAEGWVDRAFVDRHTAGYGEFVASLEGQGWEALERLSGASREEMRAFARMVGQAETAVFVWSMGITQHAFGEDNVRAIVNLALTKGFVGRDGCGLMPIRGHSGVQGGAEMGAYATAFPGGRAVNSANAAALEAEWGFPVPAEPGLTAPRMVAAAHDGALEVLYSAGGNFVEVLPEPSYVAEALGRVPVRVHQDIVLSSQMLLGAREAVVLLPAATRYETPGGLTETTTERRILVSPEVKGRRVGEARPEWRIFQDLAQRVRPDLADRLDFQSTAAIRQEIARMVGFYDGIQHLKRIGDQFQYGGAHLCAGWRFPTPDGVAHFTPVALPETKVAAGAFRVATRRGKQFNTIIHEATDAITGAGREAVLMSGQDARRLGLADGQPVVLTSETGTFRGRVLVAPMKPGNLEVHWPEGNVLIDHEALSREVDIPDYNATVTVEAVLE